MKIDMQRLLLLQKFFQVQQESSRKIILHLKLPSTLLLQNIHYSWLKCIYDKSSNHFPVYLNRNVTKACKERNYGFISHHTTANMKNIIIECKDDKYLPINMLNFQLNVIVPQTDIMQCFIQWQRYRKYWWSSVTTTPSLFSVNDMEHNVDNSNVNIMANFSWGPHIVETVNINSNGEELNRNNINAKSCLTCNMGVETAFLTLLLDGLTNTTKEEYLRLHNKMAPYKISFALDSEGTVEDPKVLHTLKELSTLLYHKLNIKKISSWLPNFTLPLKDQITENLHLGVTYTVILNENTLANGIFHLLNSSTMLKEQVHVADFDSYAALLCGKK